MTKKPDSTGTQTASMPSPAHFTQNYKQAASAGPFARFFTRRGALDLKRDSAGHRRYAWLYEDMLT